MIQEYDQLIKRRRKNISSQKRTISYTVSAAKSVERIP
jgi:hypothetical protein